MAVLLNVSVSEGLTSVRERVKQLPGMWFGAYIRLLAVEHKVKLEHEVPPQALRLAQPSADDNLFDTLGAHIQLSPTQTLPNTKVRIRLPRLVEGFLSIEEISDLMERWGRGEPATVSGEQVAPPAVSPGVVMRQSGSPGLNYPLLEELPTRMSEYEIDRWQFGGQNWGGGFFNWLLSAVNNTQPQATTAYEWALTYMNMVWRMEAPTLLIQLPLAVGVDATYDPASKLIEISIHYRDPFRPEDFAVRLGEGYWDESLRAEHPAYQGQDEHGWRLARCYSSGEPGGIAKVWVSVAGSDRPFDAMVPVDLGLADTRANRRMLFLHKWYTVGQQRYGDHVATRAASQPSGSKSADDFEIALANAFGALGCQVAFGGHGLKTAGVDFVAFHDPSGTAFLVSATISNDIAKKLQMLVRIEDELRRALEPLWTVVPMIISSEPRKNFAASDCNDAELRGVRVLGAEALGPLGEEPPDLMSFERLLLE